MDPWASNTGLNRCMTQSWMPVMLMSSLHFSVILEYLMAMTYYHIPIYLGFNSLWRFHKLLWYGHKKLQWITVERLIAPWLLCESGVHVETKGCSVGELIFVHSRDINHVILIAQRLRLMAQHRTVVIKVLYLNGDGSCCSFRRGIWNRNYKQIKLDILKLLCF